MAQGKTNFIGWMSLIVFIIVIIALVCLFFHKADVAAISDTRMVVYKDYFFFNVATEYRDEDGDGIWEVYKRSYSWL